MECPGVTGHHAESRQPTQLGGPLPPKAVLTDMRVGDVVAGDCLHMLQGSTQVAFGEHPRSAVYLGGHGHTAGQVDSPGEGWWQ